MYCIIGERQQHVPFDTEVMTEKNLYVIDSPAATLFLPSVYRVDGYLVGLGLVCFLTKYCFVCHILPGQVGIRQNGQITLATMVETNK